MSFLLNNAEKGCYIGYQIQADDSSPTISVEYNINSDVFIIALLLQQLSCEKNKPEHTYDRL